MDFKNVDKKDLIADKDERIALQELKFQNFNLIFSFFFQKPKISLS
jgi:hypothetical protein